MKQLVWVSLIILTVTSVACSKSKQGTDIIRSPVVAGQFYPGNKQELKQTVEQFLRNVPGTKKVSGKLYGVIVPHAGYVYSGQVAAYAYKQLEGKKYDTIILIGPSHNYHLEKTAVYVGGSFRTPLGDVEIDNEFANELIKSTNLIEKNNQAHKPEHSLEVELPFLQHILTKFKIVPILTASSLSLDISQKLAEAISKVIKKLSNKKCIFVISTDMSHYPSWKDANYADKEALKVLAKYDPELLKKTIKNLLSKRIPQLHCIFCGEDAVITGMYLGKLMGADKIEIIHYANSGDVSIGVEDALQGNKSRVVGYTACAFVENFKTDTQFDTQRGEAMAEFKISEKNQKILLELARKTISEHLESKKEPSFTTDDPELTNPSAVFVTLEKKGRLRGCIGTTTPQAPLYKAVQQMAISAAFQDYRFTSVTKNELKDIEIEISVLSPLSRVKSADEIKPNVHGVIVRKGGSTGLFLPQVWEHFTKKEDFLNELCQQKAGLEPTAWKDPSKVELYIFTVFAFKESHSDD